MTFTTRNRSQLLGTQVINQNTGERIGVVSQIWLDAEPFQVSILSVSEKLIGRVTKTLQLEAIPVLGPDALLVPETILGETAESNGLMRLVGTEVVTEAGVKLGKIKDFTFRIDTGEILKLTLSNLGIPLVPGLIASTFQMTVEDVVSLGGDAILAKAGAENRLERLSTSVLEQVGLVKPAWLVVVETPALPSPSLEDDEAFADAFDAELDVDASTVDAEEEFDSPGFDDSSSVTEEPSPAWTPEPEATAVADSPEVSPEPLEEIGDLEIGSLVDDQINSGIEAAVNWSNAAVETAEDAVEQVQATADALAEEVKPLVAEAVDAVQDSLDEITEAVADTGADLADTTVEQVDAVSEALAGLSEDTNEALEDTADLVSDTAEDLIARAEQAAASRGYDVTADPEATAEIDAQDAMGAEPQDVFGMLDNLDGTDTSDFDPQS